MSLPDGPFWRWLARRPLIRRIKRTMGRWMPWGEQGLSVWDVTLFFVAGMMNGAVSTRAAAISFRLFLAFFPAIIVLLSILPHTPLETEAVMDALLMFFPGDTVSLFEQTVADLLGKTQGALLSVGFALTLYYASSSVHAVLSGFNESALLDRRSNPWLMRIWAMFLMVLLVVMLGLAVLIIGFSGDLLQWMEANRWLPGEGGVWVDVARWTGAMLLIYASVTLLFNVGHLERLKWRTLTPGASMTTLLIVLLSVGFSFFIAQLNTYNRLYGSLGTFMLLLVWVNANSTVLLIGFELDASIEKARLKVRSLTSSRDEGPSQ